MKRFLKSMTILVILCSLLTGTVSTTAYAASASKKVSIATYKLGKKGKKVTYRSAYWKPTSKSNKILVAKIKNKTSKKVKEVYYTVTLYAGKKKILTSKRYTTDLAKKSWYFLAWEVPGKVTKATYKVTKVK